MPYATREAKAARQRARRERGLAMTREYKAARGCADCGERDPIVLEFHHHDDNKDPRLRPQGRHDMAVLPPLDLFREMMKCTVICANDHKRRHAHG